MATPPPQASDQPEVQQHYLTQLALTGALSAALMNLWPSFDPKRPRATFEPLRRGAAALVSEMAPAAIEMAAEHFEAMREDAHIVQPFRVPVIEAPTPADVEAYLDKAVADLLDGGTTEFGALRAAIEREIDSAAQKMLADAASDELLAAVEADPQAIGWARVTREGACAFCLMLTTRGPVYRSKVTANFRAHVAVNGRGGTCHCTVEPLWRGVYEPPAHIREAQVIWKKSTKGRSGKDALRAFRRELEGGTLRERPVPKPVPQPSQRAQFDALIGALAAAGATPAR